MDELKYQQKMQRRKEVQEQRLAQRNKEKGLIIVNTGNGKVKPSPMAWNSN